MKPSKTIALRRLVFKVLLLLFSLATFWPPANAQTIALGEAVDNISLTWTTGGDAEWFGQTLVYYYDGDAAQSGNVTSGQTSWTQTTVTGPGILSFYWKVSSSFAWTDLTFYIDGVEGVTCWADQAWELKTYSIPSGSHTLKWVYEPFLQGYAGFLDKVVYVPGPVVLVESPNGGETWYHRNAYAIRWVSTEDIGPSVKLELNKAGNSIYTISASTANDGYYRWFVPTGLEPRADYRIRIRAISDPSVYDYSDGYFSIAGWYQSSFRGLLVLDGVDDYALAEDQSELDVGDETGESLTIEAWVNIQGTGYFGDSLYITKPDSYELYLNRYYSGSNTYGCVGIFLTSPGGQLWGRERCEWPPYSLGWHHVAGVFYQDTGEVRLYLDGEAFSDPYYFGPALKNSTESLKVGGTLPGAVDDLRISAVARYTGSSYTVPTSPFNCDENSRALWHFDEFEGATIFHDTCGVIDNFLVGYNGAHTEGELGYQAYFPFVAK